MIFKNYIVTFHHLPSLFTPLSVPGRSKEGRVSPQRHLPKTHTRPIKKKQKNLYPLFSQGQSVEIVEFLIPELNFENYLNQFEFFFLFCLFFKLKVIDENNCINDLIAIKIKYLSMLLLMLIRIYISFFLKKIASMT